ncbi:MAG: HEAT repeat domain-containing protein [bacterium]
MSDDKIKEKKDIAKLIINIIKYLHLSSIDMKLYPVGSEIITNALKFVYNPLIAYFQEKEDLIIAESNGNLIINGQIIEIKESEKNIVIDFAFTLVDKEIKSIVFKKGLTLDEIRVFVDCLSKKGEKLKDEGGIIEVFKKNNVSHIIINEIIYVAMSKDEKEEKKDFFSSWQKGDEIQVIIKTLEKNTETISSIADEIAKKEIIKQSVEKILDFDVDILIKFFEHTLPSQVEKLKIKKEILNTISVEKLESIFNQIMEKYEELKKEKTIDNSINIDEQSTYLKKFLEKIVESPSAKECPLLIYEEMFNKGLLEESEWLKKKETKVETFSFIEEVKNLIKENNLSSIENILSRSPLLIQNICIMEEKNLLKQIIEKIENNFHNQNNKICLQAVKILRHFFYIFTQQGQEELLAIIENYFVEQIKMEKHSEIYHELAYTLVDRAKQYLLMGDFHKLILLIDLFKKHHLVENQLVVERHELSRKVLEKIAFELQDILLVDLKSDDHKIQYASSQVILKLGEVMIEFLIKIVKENENENIRVQEIIKFIFKNIGDNAKKAVIKELLPDMAIEQFKNLMNILVNFDDYSVIDQLKIILKSSNPKLREEVIKIFFKLNTPSAVKLLIDQIDDSDYLVKIKIIKYLGELKSRESIEKLIHLLTTTKHVDIQKEICYSFEKIKDPRVISVLFSIIKERGNFFWKKTYSLSIRILAIYGLKNFLNSEVKTELEHLSKDKNPAIRDMIKTVLEGK